MKRGTPMSNSESRKRHTAEKAAGLIAVSFPTIMDGLVVRWYADDAAEGEGREMASASRERAIVNAGGTDFAALVEDVHHRIAEDGHNADLTDVLTHKRKGLFGPLVPLVGAAS